MSNNVENTIQLRSPKWQVRLPRFESLCHLAANATWVEAFNGSGKFEMTIVLADDVFIQELNLRYRKQDKPTNVLSFPHDNIESLIPNHVNILGDIVISFEALEREAPQNLSHHLSHLVVHGCLHLLGYDHEDDQHAEKMERLEAKILWGLGIKDPYGEKVPSLVTH